MMAGLRLAAGSEGAKQLPMALGPSRERSDAARNRARILEAAAALLDDSAEDLTMDAIAARSGVGVATLYRRFGDRDGLLAALLDVSERSFQDAFLHGPAPLGPDGTGGGAADACSRVRAFVHALSARVECERELRSAAAGKPFSAVGPYGTWRLHLTRLLAAIGPPAVADVDAWADALLMIAGPAARAAGQAHGADAARRGAALDLLLDRLLDSDRSIVAS